MEMVRDGGDAQEYFHVLGDDVMMLETQSINHTFKCNNMMKL